MLSQNFYSYQLVPLGIACEGMELSTTWEFMYSGKRDDY